MMYFIIPGKPIVQQRPRRGKYGNFYDPSSKERKNLSMALLHARATSKSSILEGEIWLDITFYGCGKRCDLSNMIKAFEDSANGILWKDDKQITQIAAKMKRQDQNPRTEIRIYDFI